MSTLGAGSLSVPKHNSSCRRIEKAHKDTGREQETSYPLSIKATKQEVEELGHGLFVILSFI